MLKHGYPDTSMLLANDFSYDYATTAEEQDTQVLRVDKDMRENVNFRCKNASYPIKGGNEICSMYIAV